MVINNLFNVLLAICLASSGQLLADVIAPDESSCQRLSEGDSCRVEELNRVGKCKKRTCYRLDYSKGTPPQGSVAYDCLKCEVVDEAKSDEAKSAGCSTINSNANIVLTLISLGMGLLLVAWLRRARV